MRTRSSLVTTLVSLALGCLAGAALAQPMTGPSGPAAQATLKPSPLPGLLYDKPFFLDAQGNPTAYAPNVPTGEQLLGWPIGQRAATHAEIERCFKAWDGKGPTPGNGQPEVRAKLYEHGKTWEGRTLYHMVISSPANIARLDDLKKDIARLSDQRGVSQADADKLTDSLPAVAWMAYSIHGEETSGSDAGLALAYHLIAATDDATKKLLENEIVVIDPMMNPDGRDRFLKMVAEHRAANPNVDDQSLLHSGYWPYGRTNHYFVDMNRDWIFATQPETRGRIGAVREWNPQLFIDAHEMGAQDTFLMNPSREPYNAHHPVNRKGWMSKFAAVEAHAFDKYGWRYYTGEWNEGWYPGYSDSWAAFRGAIGMLFEQARMAEDGVRRHEGTILSYRESVHHQAVGSLANLNALLVNKAQVMKEYAKERREAIAETGPTRWFTVSGGRMDRLRETLRLEGIECATVEEFKAANATDRMGRAETNRQFPAGTLLIPMRQPDAHLAATLLDFDPRFSDAFLQRERRELLRYGHSRLYDITAWNLTMLFDADTRVVEALTPATPKSLPAPQAAAAGPGPAQSAIGWIVPHASDSGVTAAARLMERGVRVRIATKDWKPGGKDIPRGSILVTRVDNQNYPGDLLEGLRAVERDAGVQFEPIATGLGAGNENPDLGSENFALLTTPRIAILTRGSFDMNNVGECWFTVDQTLGVRSTLLDLESLSGADLRRYNVLIVPEAYDDPLKDKRELLASWVKSGGTLIAIGASAGAIATGPAEDDKKPGGGPGFGYTDPGAHGGGGGASLSSVRQLSDVLEKLDEYELQVLREWEARHATVKPDAVWSGVVDPQSVAYPWQPPKKEKGEKGKDETSAGPQKKDSQAGDEPPMPGAKPDKKKNAKDAKDGDAKGESDDGREAAGGDKDAGGPGGGDEKLDKDELKRRDEWNRLFMPTGAILASRLDDRHWLTMGCRTRAESLVDESDMTSESMAQENAQSAALPGGDDYLPVLYTGGTTLMAGEGVEAPIRFGYYLPIDPASPDAGKTPAKIGWARNPPGQRLTLRMSGLLWPEAALRMANTAFVTRESMGEGQVILFACDPTFRHATLGTARVLQNAIVFGPGLGAHEAIQP